MKKKLIPITFIIIIITINISYAQVHAPSSTPRITPDIIKALLSKEVKYLFIDNSTFGDGHICGAMFISYLWCPPYGPKEKIKEIKIPKDYYLFCYWTWPDESDSARVADYLIRNGYTKAYAVKGGLQALKKAGGFPICPGILWEKWKDK